MNTQPDTYKAIVFDVDRSLTTLGGPERQEEIFGIRPVPTTSGIQQISQFLNKFLTVERVEMTHPVIGAIGYENKIRFNNKAKELGLNMMVIDSLSVLGMQERENIMKENDLTIMDLQAWGQYGQRMTSFINKMNNCSFPVIMTSHSKREKDEHGIPIEVPALKGASADEASRFFDVVVYTKTTENTGDSSGYLWYNRSTSRYTYAKNRKNLLEGPTMDQNFRTILDTYADAGIYDPKIFVIGDSGTGKSWSLQTINP